jgi:hypothetical protein
MNTPMLRLVYRVTEWRVTPWLAGWTARALSTVGGRDFVHGWLSAFDRRFVISGWPGRGELRINLHMSRFVTRVRRVLRGAPAPRPRRAPPARPRPRVGIIGRFAGLLGIPPGLLAACPPGIELVVFDAPFRGQRADYLRALPLSYEAVELDDPVAYGPSHRRTADAIARAQLDMLVNVNAKIDAHMLLDLVETGGVVNYATGSDLLHHPRVDFELLWQMPTGYALRDGRLWCEQTGLPVESAPVLQVRGFYDARGLRVADAGTWRARQPLMVSHGSLYKFAVPMFCACMFDVLDAVPGSAWVLIGKDNGAALASIAAQAAARGLGDRVRYEGEFSAVRDAAGAFIDPGWLRLQERLASARLAPDPFPIGSGSARFEAYMFGVPSVHMAPTARDGALTLNSSELPLLSIPMATASSIAQYREMAIRCLTDEAFGDAVQRAQLAAARAACDPAVWWQDIAGAARACAAGRRS